MSHIKTPHFNVGDKAYPNTKSAIGTPDNRDWGLFDNSESFVPTALNHCFTLVYTGMNSRGYKIGRTSGTGCYNIWYISATGVHGCAIF